ncbi:MAG: hypothetical protein ACK5JO_07070 [Halodesulfovibrio sp.]
MNGIELIAAERARQIEKEGWTPEHDDQHEPEELELAAACYAMPPKHRGLKLVAHHYAYDEYGHAEFVPAVGVPTLWPWEGRWWKPGPTRDRDLAKAGALAAAALDLRMRLEVAESEVGE